MTASAASALLVALFSPLAPSDATTTCVEASDRGQVLRDGGRLGEARQQFSVCAGRACPLLVQSECAKWLQEIEVRIPSVMLRVHDSDGRDLVAVRVLVDGVLLVERLDGRTIQLDPGVRTLRFEHAGFAAADREVLIREAERERPIDVTLERLSPLKAAPWITPTATASVTGTSAPWLAIASGGVGVLGIGGFTAFGLAARADVRGLEETCAPSCSPDALDGARTKALVANISLGVGVVALAAAAYFWFSD